MTLVDIGGGSWLCATRWKLVVTLCDSGGSVQLWWRWFATLADVGGLAALCDSGGGGSLVCVTCWRLVVTPCFSGGSMSILVT